MSDELELEDEEEFEVPEPVHPEFEVARHGPLLIKLLYDEDAESPREWDNLGTMVTWHRRYNLGDEQPGSGSYGKEPNEWMRSLVQDCVPYDVSEYAEKETKDEEIARLFDRFFLALPLYLFDHSGISISTGAFGCPWDSGQVGWIYVSKKDALKNWDKKRLTDKVRYNHDSSVKTVRERAYEVMEGEVETYDDYLRGNVAGYVIEDFDGEHVDSCFGFFPDRDKGKRYSDGYDYLREQAIEAAEACKQEHFAAMQSGEH